MAGYRPPYTLDEDELILKTIIDTKGFYGLRGTEFWKDFANCGIIDRTWQSLKERFKKEIVPNIFNSKYNIPKLHKKMIYVAYKQTERQKKISLVVE